VPLNRPALSLGAGSRGVKDARRWVVGAFEDMGRSDLSECAEVAVSELVTNALLHGEPPIQVRVRGTQEHPRVEVRDGSSDPPRPPEPHDPDDETMLLTVGRGLDIVARASEAWGAEIESNGKVVWFTPARELSDEPGDEPLVTGAGDPSDQTGELAADPERFALLGVPVLDYITFQNHFRELRREVRLLTLAHESDYPLARDLSAVFDSLGRPLTLGIGSAQIAAALGSGRTTTDLEVTMSRSAARGFARFVELLDLTDAFCREERMLSLARSPAQRRFQNWFLGEFVRQSEGSEPQPWTPAETAGGSTGGAAAGERHSSVS
jgi:anti-sigma regulatory factor (Ser/Thr protein kinase)